MDPAVRQLIQTLHRTACPYVLALTGGGTTAAAQLLSVPGGSRTVLEVVVPYHEQALTEFLGRAPEHYCSVEASQAMAQRAYERAGYLLPRQTVAGVGCTASLATDRPKRGEHRFHLTIRPHQQITSYSLILSKGARDRAGEESILDAVLLNALAESMGIGERLLLPLLADETLQREVQPAGGLVTALLQGQRRTICVEADGRLRDDAPLPAVLLPGSFNPLHHGHRQLAAVAERIVGQPAALEMSVVNVDKPPLTVAEIGYRLRQFAWRAPLWLTHAPTFVEKAALFPGVVFVVGADTAERIVAPQYYQGSAEQMTVALSQMRGLGCRFLVAGRADKAGAFTGMDTISLPAALRDLFTAIPESVFRLDISSTALRGSLPQTQAIGC